MSPPIGDEDIYRAMLSPLAQPRNLLGGHTLSALVGVTAQLLFGGEPILAASLAVALLINNLAPTGRYPEFWWQAHSRPGASP